MPIPNLYASGKNVGGVHEPQPSRIVAITDHSTFGIIIAETIG